MRGNATSGGGGRSFSLGIAASVTALAANAAAADAAATIVANAVNADHPAIERRPARELDPDSDLLDLLVTTHVGQLPAETVAEALDRAAAEARRLGVSAALCLQGQSRLEGTPCHPQRVASLSTTEGESLR